MSFASKFTSILSSENLGIGGLFANTHWCPSPTTRSSNPSISTRGAQSHAEFRIAKNHAVVSKLIAKLLAEHARIDYSGKMVGFVDDFS
jgi:hypothetical protein